MLSLFLANSSDFDSYIKNWLNKYDSIMQHQCFF